MENKLSIVQEENLCELPLQYSVICDILTRVMKRKMWKKTHGKK